MAARAILVSAAASGVGKTSITAGLLAAARRRGLAVAAAKTGPDYIDPTFHRLAAGGPCVNLDSWAMAPGLLSATASDASRGADLLVIEGAMGLFDGLPDPAGGRGAAADIAAVFGIPVVLVLDVSGQAQTAAAVASGLAGFDPAVRVAGVILNRVASGRHADQVAAAMHAVGMPVLGTVPRNALPTLPSRHLGLVTGSEHPAGPAVIAILAETMERSLDVAAIIAAAGPLANAGPALAPILALPPPGRRIALASDPAFSFMYDHVLAGWRQAGAVVIPFSPLADEPPAADCDCCWLPGGYPELHAGRLAASSRFLSGLRQFAQSHPVHGECGGFMVLGEALTDADGVTHRMAALLGHATSFAERRLTLGYRRARPRAALAFAPAGTEIRGHEFHYATLSEAGTDAPLVDLADGMGNAIGAAGSRRGNVTGTWFHAIAIAAS